MSPQPFEYLTYYIPNEEAAKAGAKAKIIDKDIILASDLNKANILVARSVPDEYIDKLDDVIIRVRPF